MAKNEFLPFGTAANANVIPNADYQALPARTGGFSSGVAKSEQMNSVWRQSSVIASVLAQFIADKSGNDVLDDGNTAVLQDSLTAALLNAAPGRLLNVQRFTSSGMYVPTPGTKFYVAELIGAGGGSAAAPATGANEVSISCGGGAGAYAKGKFNNDGVNKTIIIGAGGAGGSVGSIYANDGGMSSFGALITAPGGKAGLPAGPASPPFQPVANTTSDNPIGGNLISAPGSSASPAVAVSNSYAIGSAGASSFFGGGGWVVAINTAAAAGQAPGSGAGGVSRGNSGSAVSGARGADGMAIVWEYS
ncbi:hypothetical protein D3C79_190630 [compost metagenome]